MSYIQDNKAAWEEAFDNRRPGWGEDVLTRLQGGAYALFNSDVKKELEKIDFHGKKVAQFCCNNGRELLSLVQSSGAEKGVGFDIAENILAQGRDAAQQAGIANCEFVACSILDIHEDYYGQFDFIFFTIGAITWFEDLTLLFDKVSKCLKTGGLLLISDFHPLMNMLPLPGEEGFDENHLNRFTQSYFRKEPWIGNDGMGYMSVEYESKTFTSFSHTMSAIINGMSANSIKTVLLNEYDYDVSVTDVYNGKGFPLSFILMGEKC